MELADHAFSAENIARECGISSSSDRAWERWVADVERLLGHSIDGNDVNSAGCGYSIDEAYDVWREHRRDPASASRYVITVKARKRYDGGAFVRV